MARGEKDQKLTEEENVKAACHGDKSRHRTLDFAPEEKEAYIGNSFQNKMTAMMVCKIWRQLDTRHQAQKLPKFRERKNRQVVGVLSVVGVLPTSSDGRIFCHSVTDIPSLWLYTHSTAIGSRRRKV